MRKSKPTNRRTFLAGAGAAIGASALGRTALSYSRILGANDRISLGHIGCGRRGLGLQTIARGLKSRNLEMTAVCDLWKVNREAAAARTESWYGRAPRSFQYMEELLALKDVDAVLISTADFQHATHLKAVVEAGKDAYCEKPMANDLAEAKAAHAAAAPPLLREIARCVAGSRAVQTKLHPPTPNGSRTRTVPATTQTHQCSNNQSRHGKAH